MIGVPIGTGEDNVSSVSPLFQGEMSDIRLSKSQELDTFDTILENYNQTETPEEENNTE